MDRALGTRPKRRPAMGGPSRAAVCGFFAARKDKNIRSICARVGVLFGPPLPHVTTTAVGGNRRKLIDKTEISFAPINTLLRRPIGILLRARVFFPFLAAHHIPNLRTPPHCYNSPVSPPPSRFFLAFFLREFFFVFYRLPTTTTHTPDRELFGNVYLFAGNATTIIPVCTRTHRHTRFGTRTDARAPAKHTHNNIL